MVLRSQGIRCPLSPVAHLLVECEVVEIPFHPIGSTGTTSSLQRSCLMWEGACQVSWHLVQMVGGFVLNQPQSRNPHALSSVGLQSRVNVDEFYFVMWGPEEGDLALFTRNYNTRCTLRDSY